MDGYICDFQLVTNSSGLDETLSLARNYGSSASSCLAEWEASEFKSELLRIVDSAVHRKR